MGILGHKNIFIHKKHEKFTTQKFPDLYSSTYEHMYSLQSMSLATVLTAMFIWWEAPISMKVEWRCASMTSGGQCVMTTGTTLMLLWSAGSWDMHTLEVSLCNNCRTPYCRTP